MTQRQRADQAQLAVHHLQGPCLALQRHQQRRRLRCSGGSRPSQRHQQEQAAHRQCCLWCGQAACLGPAASCL